MSAEYQRIELSRLKPNPNNPRRSFEGKDFEDLISSIRAAGVISPILVRPLKPVRVKKTDKKSKAKSNGADFEIVAGERRWRACCRILDQHLAAGNKSNGLHTIPAIVRELSDDEAFEVMIIENLHRQDISELEEVETFKKYVDRHGKDGIIHLAEKVGKEASYVRRRLHVLKAVPKPILKAWEEGKILFGHCEQLARLRDEKIITKVYRAFTGKHDVWFGELNTRVNLDIPSVRDLQRLINSLAAPLKVAKFDLKGCGKCVQNSQVQKELLDDVTGLPEAICQDPACLKKKQREWFKSNWKEFCGGAGTNGFRFAGDPGTASWERREFNDFSGSPGEKCSSCAHFISVIDLKGKFEAQKACVGDRKCFDAIVREGQKRKEKKKDKKKGAAAAGADPGGDGEGLPETEAPHVDWHGQYFREKFYGERIPAVLKNIDAGDLKILHILLAVIFQSDHQAEKTFTQERKISSGRYSSVSNEDLWPHIVALSLGDVQQALKKAATEILMRDCGDRYVSNDNFGAAGRHAIACYLGINLQNDWRLNQAYLDAKTTKELLSLGETHGIFADEKAQSFLHETIGKKRGAFKGLKKGELVRVFLESGVDLAGKVPAEILDVRSAGKSNSEPADPAYKTCIRCGGTGETIIDEKTKIICGACAGDGELEAEIAQCRVCGCTEYCACEGGCSWVEDDLCSACEGEGSN
jgi:ParB family chromosome partitioning protein